LKETNGSIRGKDCTLKKKEQGKRGLPVRLRKEDQSRGQQAIILYRINYRLIHNV